MCVVTGCEQVNDGITDSYSGYAVAQPVDVDVDVDDFSHIDCCAW